MHVSLRRLCFGAATGVAKKPEPVPSPHRSGERVRVRGSLFPSATTPHPSPLPARRGERGLFRRAIIGSDHGLPDPRSAVWTGFGLSVVHSGQTVVGSEVKFVRLEVPEPRRRWRNLRGGDWNLAGGSVYQENAGFSSIEVSGVRSEQMTARSGQLTALARFRQHDRNN